MQEDAHRLLPFFCASVGNNDKNKDCGMIVHCRAAALVAARKRTITTNCEQQMSTAGYSLCNNESKSGTKPVGLSRFLNECSRIAATQI